MSTLTSAEHTARTRRLAANLAACEGWTDWALPALQAKVAELETNILTSRALTGEALNDARAEFRALTTWLNDLRATVTSNFTNPPPPNQRVNDEEVLKAAVPEAIIAALSPRERSAASEPSGARSPAAGSPQGTGGGREQSSDGPIQIPAPSTFSPFAGLPHPVPAPAPAPASEPNPPTA